MKGKINSFYNKKKPLIILAMFSCALIAAVSIQTHKRTLLFPGQLSAKSERPEEIEGFVSHAEFEQECGHCHGPIHCVEDSRCQDCHFDVAQQRASSVGLHGRLPGMKQCENCHPEHQGKEARITFFAYNNVNHSLLADFSLEKHRFDYDHQPMGCQSCHSQDSYIAEKLNCISCHSAEDHDDFASHMERYGSDCISCHDGSGVFSDFSHAEVYVLNGKHEDLACEECHQGTQFAGTPQNCAGCHQEPEMHAGIFGRDCERCHTAAAWFPAELQRHAFVVDHGVDFHPTCETCHQGSCTEYHCSSCHDDYVMEVVHHQEGISSIHGCVECHPSGKEAEKSPSLEQKSQNHNAEPRGQEIKTDVRAAMLAVGAQSTEGVQPRMDANIKGTDKSNFQKQTGSERGGS